MKTYGLGQGLAQGVQVGGNAILQALMQKRYLEAYREAHAADVGAKRDTAITKATPTLVRGVYGSDNSGRLPTPPGNPPSPEMMNEMSQAQALGQSAPGAPAPLPPSSTPAPAASPTMPTPPTSPAAALAPPSYMPGGYSPPSHTMQDQPQDPRGPYTTSDSVRASQQPSVPLDGRQGPLHESDEILPNALGNYFHPDTASAQFSSPPKAGSAESAGNILVNDPEHGAIPQFHKIISDLGNNYMQSFEKVNNAEQKMQESQATVKDTMAELAAKYGGNMSMVAADPAMRRAQAAFEKASVDHQQALEHADRFGSELKRYLPDLKLKHGKSTMADIGREAYKPNPTPAQFLTPNATPQLPY